MKTYLDMDGVIANFFLEAARISDTPGVGWRDMEFRDIERALNRIRKTPGFFTSLPTFPMANTLVQSIVNITGSCSILSSPLTDYSTCGAEKRQWLQDNIHYDFEEVIITANKPAYAAGNVLIDDYGENIRKWEMAGGYGIKHQSDEDNVADVITTLKALYMNQK